MKGASLVFSALSGLMRMQAAKAESKALAQQATQARIEARAKALEYKQQGVAALENIVRTNATIVARAGAGGIDPFSGSALALQRYALFRGSDEYFMSREGFDITIASGDAQAQQYMEQGRIRESSAMTGMISGIGKAAYNQSLLGGAPQKPFKI